MFLQQKLKYFGHVVHHEGMEKTIMLGMVEGVRKRGKQRMSFLDGIKEVTGMKRKHKTELVGVHMSEGSLRVGHD